MDNPRAVFYLELARLYTRYFPINKGKGKILNLALRNPNVLPDNTLSMRSWYWIGIIWQRSARSFAA